MGLSPPAVTRAISALEDRLGVRVFNRTTRSLTITDVGQRFLESARRVLTDLDTAEKEAVGEATMPQGHLTITASVTFGRSTPMLMLSTPTARNREAACFRESGVSSRSRNVSGRGSVVISESPQQPAPIAETAAVLERFLSPAPVHVLPRGVLAPLLPLLAPYLS